MFSKTVFRKISPVLWEIPQAHRQDMRVPVRLYSTGSMLEEILRDRSLEQAVNVATLPGIVEYVVVMPDAHEGYGFPIGGVAAVAWPDGVISPGGIGYDINCGVRLLRSEVTFATIAPHLGELARALYREVPSGVGRGGGIKLDAKELHAVLKDGVQWAIQQSYGEADDALRIESEGTLPDADPDAVSERAKARGCDQLGTMGAGNHFVEVERVLEIFDEEAAEALRLFNDQIVVLVHCGSRGLGHQVATDYISTMQKTMPKYKIELPDRELASAPFSSPEGKAYWSAMAAAANFAWTNRELITWEVRKAWHRLFRESGGKLAVLYDVAHNIAKIEEYNVGGVKKKLIVHRKGATRAFGPGHPALSQEFREIGQPVIIPGSMGTASYVLLGTNEAMQESFGSSCHGAGRRLSRHAAKRKIHGAELRAELEKEGIHVEAGSLSGLAEEAPFAYKDVREVVEVVTRARIARKVASLKPVAVIKG